MKLYQISTDTEVFIVTANNEDQAESIVIDDSYRHVLDDDLSDLLLTEEIGQVIDTKAEIKVRGLVA